MPQFLQRTQETPHTCSERPWKAKPSLPLSFPPWISQLKSTGLEGRKQNGVRKGNKVGGEKANSRLSTDSWLMGLVIFLMLCFLTVALLFSGKKVSPSSLSLTSNFILTSVPVLKSSFFQNQTAEDFCARMAADASPLLQYMHSRVTINYKFA